MEQVKDFRLTATPKILILATLLFFAGRLGLSVYEFLHPRARGPAVAWTELKTFESSGKNSSGKKLILYEFYADWCDPCKRLERDVMTNTEIRSLMEQNFVTLRVTDEQREKGRNDARVYELQKKYRVFAFPTLVAVDEDGEAIESLVGNSSSLAVYRFMSRVMHHDKTRPKASPLSLLKKAWQKG